MIVTATTMIVTATTMIVTATMIVTITLAITLASPCVAACVWKRVVTVVEPHLCPALAVGLAELPELHIVACRHCLQHGRLGAFGAVHRDQAAAALASGNGVHLAVELVVTPASHITITVNEVRTGVCHRGQNPPPVAEHSVDEEPATSTVSLVGGATPGGAR